MPASESPAHLELKRLSLIWAQANGYPVAACEVALPNLRFRLDVGAYRPGSAHVTRLDKKRGVNRSVKVHALGISAVFECKVSRTDLVRDCRNAGRLNERIRELTAQRLELETQLRVHEPSLLNGDGLWPEYHTLSPAGAGHQPYRKVMKALATLSRQLHGQTKMENLFRWNAANLHYLVVEDGLIAEHEVPLGWGLLVRSGRRLELRLRPQFRGITQESQLSFLHRVAAAGTKSSNRQAGVRYEEIDAERRGMELLEAAEEEVESVP